MKHTPKQPAADVESIRWCYAKLDDPHVQPTNAPSAGAWSMLVWAREDRNSFYTPLVSKILVATVPSERPSELPTPWPARTREELLESYDDHEGAMMRLQIFRVSEQLIADAETLVADWTAEVGATLIPEGRTALVAAVADLVHMALTAATRHPAAFAKYFVGRE